MKTTTSQKKYIGRVIPPELLVPVAIAGILIVAVSLILEYQTRKDEYFSLLEDQASMFINTVSTSAQDAFSAAGVFEEEITALLQSNLRLVSELELTERSGKSGLQEILQKSGFPEIRYYGRNGNLLNTLTAGEGDDSAIPPRVITGMIERGASSMQYVLRDTVNFINDRLALIIPHDNRGALAGIIDSERIRNLRNQFGFGNFLSNFQQSENVEYIVLQNEQTIIAGKFGNRNPQLFLYDSFISDVYRQNSVNTRISRGFADEIFEAAAPFGPPDSPLAVIRIGLSLEDFISFNDQVKRRLIIMGGVIAFFGLIILNFVLVYRHRQLLSRDLKQLSQYTNHVLEDLGSGVISVDNTGKIELINRKGIEFTGGDYASLFGKPYTQLPHPMNEVISHSLKSEPTAPAERSWITVNGENRWISLKVTKIDNDQGESARVLMIDDVTEEARLEEQLRRNQKLASMRKLASSVAHEIRNPLNSILLLVGLVQKKFQPEPDNEKYNGYLDTIQREIMRISSIVEEFLKFARPPKLKFEIISFPDFFVDIENIFRARMEEAGLRFTCEIDDHPEITGDREKLKQVFINLIENAADATPENGAVSVTGKTSGEVYEFSVTDTGKGIAEQEKAHIFDLYYTTKKTGSGIGLSVVDQIVAGHKGTITVNSEPGIGTEFFLQFPVSGIHEMAGNL